MQWAPKCAQRLFGPKPQTPNPKPKPTDAMSARALVTSTARLNPSPFATLCAAEISAGSTSRGTAEFRIGEPSMRSVRLYQPARVTLNSTRYRPSAPSVHSGRTAPIGTAHSSAARTFSESSERGSSAVGRLKRDRT